MSSVTFLTQVCGNASLLRRRLNPGQRRRSARDPRATPARLRFRGERLLEFLLASSRRRTSGQLRDRGSGTRPRRPLVSPAASPSPSGPPADHLGIQPERVGNPNPDEDVVRVDDVTARDFDIFLPVLTEDQPLADQLVVVRLRCRDRGRGRAAPCAKTGRANRCSTACSRFRQRKGYQRPGVAFVGRARSSIASAASSCLNRLLLLGVDVSAV